ncbi:MAG TPA: Spy/CpxP family protein refolding chaperone [Myxococcota bacterium]|nr:Spy/CpxP family protein refolding chaperone [Myxococcota bacterium]
MFQIADTLARGFATATLLSALGLAGPSHAAPTVLGQGAGVDAAPATAVLAQATTPEAAPTPPQTPSKETPSGRSHGDWVETRIKELHQKLKITAAQESQWNAFAQVMRENAQAVDAVLAERSENLHAMNAVEDLRSYEKLADAHADGLKKLVPAFEALYNTMSADQKKTADTVFAKHEKRPRHASK